MKMKFLIAGALTAFIGISSVFAQTSQQPVAKQGDTTSSSPMFRKGTRNEVHNKPQATGAQTTTSPLYGKTADTTSKKVAAPGNPSPLAKSAPKQAVPAPVPGAK